MVGQNQAVSDSGSITDSVIRSAALNRAVSDIVNIVDTTAENIGSFLLNQSKNIKPHGSTQVILAEGALRNVNV